MKRPKCGRGGGSGESPSKEADPRPGVDRPDQRHRMRGCARLTCCGSGSGSKGASSSYSRGGNSGVSGGSAQTPPVVVGGKGCM